MIKHPERIFEYARRYLLGYGIEDPSKNGEFRILDKMVKGASVIFEVGANIGIHIGKYLEYNPKVKVHGFEPAPGSFQELERKFKENPSVILNNIALSNAPGEMDFYLYWDTGGGNSLYYNDYQADVSKEVKIIKVNVDTLDRYIAALEIKEIDFIKIDVEGHEYKVLLGLASTLKQRSVKAIQFEYTPFTVQIGDSLLKIGELLVSHGFRIYRITPWGKLRVRNFSANDHRSGNYLALLD